MQTQTGLLSLPVPHVSSCEHCLGAYRLHTRALENKGTRARTSLASSAVLTVAAVLWGRWVHPLTQEWGNNQGFQPDPHYMVWSCKPPLKIKEAKEMVQGVTWSPEPTLK